MSDIPIPEEALKAAHKAALERWMTGSSDTTQMQMSVTAALLAAWPLLQCSCPHISEVNDYCVQHGRGPS